MISKVKASIYRALRKTEKYTKTDMVAFFAQNFWLTATRVTGILFGMVLTFAFANLLTPSEFGTYKYALAAAGLVGAFSLNGLNASVMRVVAQGKKNAVPGIVRASVLWSIPASIVAAFVACYYFWQGNNLLGFVFLIIATFNSLNNGAGLTKSIFMGVGDFKTQLTKGFARGLFPVIAILITLLLTHNVIYILLAYFASNTVASWSMYLWTLRHFKIKSSSEHVKEALNFGKHMSLLGVFVLVGGQLDQLVLWHFSDAATLGMYALALAPVQYVNGFLGNFASIAFPKLASKTKSEIRKALPLRLGQMFLVSLAAAVGYIILAPFVFTALFPKYHDAIYISQILAIIIIFQPKTILDAMLTAHGEVHKRYTLTITTQIIEFGLILTLIPIFGLWGAVAATVFTELCSAVTLYILYRST